MTAKRPKRPLALGELLRAAGLVQARQLQAALRLQRSNGQRLGDTLVQLANLDARDAAATLMVQHKLREQLAQEPDKTVHALPDCLRLGELLVARGDVPRNLLEQALQQQHGQQLGDALLHMGAISAATLERVLPLQKRLLSAVLCAGFGFAFAFSSPAAQAGPAPGGSAWLSVSATVAKRIHVQMKSQPGSFTLDAQDIARGYLDIPLESVFAVETNSPEGVALEFHGIDNGADIQAVQISGGSSAFRMPASGGVMLLQEGWHPTVERTFHLGYRLTLGPMARVGTYGWPFTLSVSAL